MERLVLLGLNIVFSSLSGLAMYGIWYYLYARGDRQPDIRTGYYGLEALMTIYFCPFILLASSARTNAALWNRGFLQWFTPVTVRMASVLAVVWLWGALFSLYRYGRSIILYRIAGRGTMEANIQRQRLAGEVAGLLGIRGRIQVREGYGILSPELKGWLRAEIRIPVMRYEEEQLRYIFTHELVHFRSRDVLIRELMVLVACVYWFNPVCRKMLAQIRIWSELHCDDEVCACPFTDRKRYMTVLYEMAETVEKGRSWLTPGLYEQGSELERRIMTMRRNRGLQRRHGVRVLAVALAFGAVGSGTALAAGGGVARLYGEAVAVSAVEQAEEEGASESGRQEMTIVPDSELLALMEASESEINPLALGDIDLTITNDIYFSPAFRVSVGDEVTIGVGIKPSDVTVYVGLAQPDGVWRYVVGSGSINHTFQITQNGRHKLYVWNKTDTEVTVIGYYTYE